MSAMMSGGNKLHHTEGEPHTNEKTDELDARPGADLQRRNCYLCAGHADEERQEEEGQQREEEGATKEGRRQRQSVSRIREAAWRYPRGFELSKVSFPSQFFPALIPTL